MKPKKRIFITRRLDPTAERLLGESFEVVTRSASEPLAAGDLVAACRGFDGVLSTVSDRFCRAVFEQLDGLEVISNYAVGLDNIDLTAAAEHGVAIYHLPNVVVRSTAEHTMALLLAWVRKVGQGDALIRDGRWQGWMPDLCLGEDLGGKVLGILGLGRIGQAVARRALAFDLEVIYHNRRPANLEPELEGRVRRVSFADLQRRSDFLSIHVPLTDSTRGLVDADFLRSLERAPLILNMARGDVIDAEALVEALDKGWVRGAALDVTSPEPIPADHPLLAFEQCLITPHIGTSTVECRRDMAHHAALNLQSHYAK